MSLEPQSQAVIDALNGSGVLPFRQFTPLDVREKILVARPAAAGSDSCDGKLGKKQSAHPTERFAYAYCVRALQTPAKRCRR